jgi:hypothetical protein
LPLNVWSILLEWFVRFLSVSTCGSHCGPTWRNNLESMGITAS